MPRTLRVGLHQAQPGSGLPGSDRARYRDAGIEVLVLPEYYWVRPEDRDHRSAADHHDEDVRELAAVSREEDWVVVGGTVVESNGDAVHNACPVFHRGEELGRYRKIHLMPGEAADGVRPGKDFVVVDVLGLRLAPVICADVLHPDTFGQVAELHPDLILAPMSSPYLPEDTPRDKDARDRDIFLKGAAQARTSIVKVGGAGSVFGHPLQGRCLVVTPDKILFRTPFDQELSSQTWVVDVPVSGSGA